VRTTCRTWGTMCAAKCWGLVSLCASVPRSEAHPRTIASLRLASILRRTRYHACVAELSALMRNWGCIWQRPSRSIAYHDSGCGTQKKKTGGPTSGCSAKLSRRCRTSRRWRETGAGNLGIPAALYAFRSAMLASAAESGSPWGEGDMANRLRFIAGCFPSIFLMSGLTDACAADPGFCRQFAKAAISQVRGALADPRCRAGVQGARWSTDFAAHYEWCLGASPAAAGADRDARTRSCEPAPAGDSKSVAPPAVVAMAAAAMKNYATVLCHDRARGDVNISISR
jgi:hypothetical protein